MGLSSNFQVTILPKSRRKYIDPKLKIALIASKICLYFYYIYNSGPEGKVALFHLNAAVFIAESTGFMGTSAHLCSERT